MSRHEAAVIMGTRPEAVKLAGIITELGGDARLVFTGQHYDRSMWLDVVRDLGLPEPEVRLAVGGRSRGEQIGEATTSITRHLLDRPVGAVVVQGDTNTTLAGALAADATGTPLVHVEAGLRSFDLAMPEERNRLLVDRIADLACAPIAANGEQLQREGVAPERIIVTGNTLAETVDRMLPGPAERASTLAQLGLRPRRYVLATLHRAANVDDPAALASILQALAALAKRIDVVLPIHPRTRRRIDVGALGHLLQGITVCEPLAPSTFLSLEAEAALLVTDSGGVQEEGALLGRPVVLLRDTTERPELLDLWSRLCPPSAGLTERLLAEWDSAEARAAQIAERPSPYARNGSSAAIAEQIRIRFLATASARR